MSKPSNRSGLIDYCLRQLGAPVLEINIADEQIDDLVDDTIQFWQERHYDGVTQIYLKYQITQNDINRGRAPGGDDATAGIVTTTATASGLSSFTYKENQNYIQLPDSVIGVNKIFKYDGSQTTSNSMFSVKYQLFLNDVYYFDSLELLTYAMVKTKLEDIDYLLNTEKQIRFNIRQQRLYLDVDFGDLKVGDWLIIDCWRILNPDDFVRVYNDRFIKMYLTSLMKKQWGQNLIKFQGVKLPGGIELNGRQIYDDAVIELDKIREQMLSTYEIPPLDMIG